MRSTLKHEHSKQFLRTTRRLRVESLEGRNLLAAFSLLDLFADDGGLVISEFLHDTCDQSNLAENQGEYVVITNTNTRSMVDVSGWELDDDGNLGDADGFLVPANTAIPSGGSLIISGTTQANWVAEYGPLPQGFVHMDATAVGQNGWQNLNNTGEDIGFGNAAGRTALYSSTYVAPQGGNVDGQALTGNPAQGAFVYMGNTALNNCGAVAYNAGANAVQLVANPTTGSAAGPNNITTDTHYLARQAVNDKATGVDLPTTIQVTGQNFVDTEWSGVAYHDNGAGTETIWVVPDEEARIEIYRLHASTIGDHDNNQNTPNALMPIRTIPINGFANGPEGIAWMGQNPNGGDDFAFVWEGLGGGAQIHTATITANTTALAVNPTNNETPLTTLPLIPNIENDQSGSANDGLEGVAYDPNFNNPGQNPGAFYVVKEKLNNQGIWRVNPNNGVATQPVIAGFNNNTLNNANGNDRDGQLFADFSDVHFANNMLFVTSEQGEETVARVNLNTMAVDQLVTKLNRTTANNNNLVSFNAFINAVPNAAVQEIFDDEDVLMNDLEGITLKPDGTEAFIVGDDDLANGNDIIDYRWLVDRTQMARIDFDGDGNEWRDIGDIDAIAVAIAANSNNMAFDLNGDQQVTAADGLYLVQRLMQIPLGDSNGDGHFDAADLVVVFGAGEYEDAVANNSTWAEGDWNFDQEFDSQDLVVVFQEGRYE